MPIWLTCFNQGGGFADVRRNVDLPCPTVQQNGHATSRLGQYFLESDEGPVRPAPPELLVDEPMPNREER